MTESEWLTSDDPAAMLEHLNGQFVYRDGLPVSGKWPSARKLRLFACALCRAVENGTECPAGCEIPSPRKDGVYRVYESAGPDSQWVRCETCGGSGRVGGLADPRSRAAVDVAERFSDGLATASELRDANLDATIYAYSHHSPDEFATFAAAWVAEDCLIQNGLTLLATYFPYRAKACALLRCIFNPFRKPTCGWRVVRAACYMSAAALESGASEETVWCGDWMPNRSVLAIARTIYDGRQFDLLPLLADELEGAGATDPEILSHLRGPGPHVRGCHVIDMLLGKE